MLNILEQDSTYFFDVNFGGVSYTDLDLRKFKKRGLKQVAEIELQMVQTAGMFQFNSGVRSPFQDDTANEAKFKNWANRVQDCISVNELYMIGREIELETKVEFNSIVFSRDQVFGKELPDNFL